MRISRMLLSVSLIGALAGSSGAGAQAQPGTPAGPQVLPEIRIGAPVQRYPLKAREALAVRGVYELSNGWLLDVDPTFRRVYADLNQTGRVELLPVTADQFVSADGRWRCTSISASMRTKWCCATCRTGWQRTASS